MVCREFVEHLTDYLEHAQDLPQREASEAHLAECQGCRNYAAQMKQAILWMRQVTPLGRHRIERITRVALSAYSRHHAHRAGA